MTNSFLNKFEVSNCGIFSFLKEENNIINNKVCFQSHNKIITENISSNKHLYITENTILLHKDTEKILHNLFCNHKFNDFDIIFLGIGAWDISRKIYEKYMACINNKYQLFILDEKIHYTGMYSYIVNKNSIKKLINIININSHINSTNLMLKCFIEDKTIKTFCMLPMLAIPNYLSLVNNKNLNIEQFECIYKLFYKNKSLNVYQNIISLLLQKGYILSSFKENNNFQNFTILLEKIKLGVKTNKLIHICPNVNIPYMQEVELNSEDKRIKESFKKSKKLYENKKYKESNDIAIRLQSNKEASIYNLIAFNYLKDGQKNTALEYFNYSLELNKYQVLIIEQTAYLEKENKNYRVAIELYHHLLSIQTFSKTETIHYLNNIGFYYSQIRDYKNAIKTALRIIDIDPDDVNNHLILYHYYLIVGDYKNGLKQYEWRFKDDNHISYDLSNMPYYNKGDSLNGKRLFITPEYGLGDCIQYARFISVILNKTNVSKITFIVYSNLVSIFNCLESSRCEVIDVDKIKFFNIKSTQMSMQIPIGSIMYRMNFTINDVKPIPYLRTTNKISLQINKNKLNIGLAWRGNSEHERNSSRNIHLKTLESLLSIQNINFYSLHIEDINDDIAKYGYENKIIDLSGIIKNVGDTASIIKKLDLIISVDTMIAHLSGALGIKVFLLLHYKPDCRWLADGEKSCWYESIKLFRQENIDDYLGVIENVKHEVLSLSKKFKREGQNKRV